jgi:hypothetical protein
VPVEVLHPFRAGPRYFFYPYVLLGWSVIWLAAETRGKVRAAMGALLFLSIALALPGMARKHDAFDWRAELEACARSDRYALPLHFTGDKALAWRLELTGPQCASLIARSVF